MTDTIRQFSKSTPDRKCMTCGMVSARKDFVKVKCGKCHEKYGPPRTAQQYAPKPMKLGVVK
jgi:hypothetical protein